MENEMIDWNKNLYGYTGRELCKRAGNSEGGLAYRMLDLGGWIGYCYNGLEIHSEIRGRANPTYLVANLNNN